MINPNNTTLLANSLEDVLETIVSSKLLDRLSLEQRTRIVWLIGQWSRPSVATEKDPVGEIKKILDIAKSRIAPKKQYGTGQYLKIKQND